MSSSGSARRTLPEWFASQVIVIQDSEPRSRSPHRQVASAPLFSLDDPLMLVLMNRLGKLETICSKHAQQFCSSGHHDVVQDDRLTGHGHQIDQLRDCVGHLDHDLDMLFEGEPVRIQRLVGLEASSTQLKNDMKIAHELYTCMRQEYDQTLDAHRDEINSHGSRFSCDIETLTNDMKVMSNRIDKLEKENAELKVQLHLT